jgi:hypothetical protein
MKANYIYAIIAFVLFTALAIAISWPDSDLLPERIRIDSFDAAYDYTENVRSINVFGTGSMHPLIPRGDPKSFTAVVTLDDTPYCQIKIGHVAAFYYAGGITIHAVVGTSGRGFIMQGWTNPIPDNEPMTAQNFIGRVDRVFVWQ